MGSLRNVAFVLPLAALLGCPSPTAPLDTSSGSTSGQDEVESGSGESEDTDSGASESESGDTTTGEPVECFDGIAPLPFDASASAVGYDLPAPDFVIDELRGPQALSDFWTGCENHVFVLYSANWWNTPIDALVDDSDPDTHYWFIDDAASHDLDMRTAVVGQIAQRIEAALAARGPEVHAARTMQFHYVVTAGADIPLVAGIRDANPNEAHFTVDRHQLVREGHNVAVFNGSWTPLLDQTRYWAKYYNAQYALDARLEAEAADPDVFVYRLADGEAIHGEVPFEWTLPDAATIAQYDRLELDLRVDCPAPGHPYGATCGEWDTIAYFFVCNTPDCSESGKRRLVKWITPYSAPGRWLFDITPELLTLAAGGDMTFMAIHGDNDNGQYTYRYTIDLRFSKARDGLRPIGRELLVPDGNYVWASDYHTMFGNYSIVPPPGTERVELDVKISGHGATPGDSCGEFCTFTHQFTVGDTPFAHQYRMENVNRCAENVAQGVTPNQGGTWFFDRSSWCPGWTIEEWKADVTAAMNLAGETPIVYTSWIGANKPSTDAGASVDARVELVYHGSR